MSTRLCEPSLRDDGAQRGTLASHGKWCDTGAFKLDETPSPVVANVSSTSDASFQFNRTPSPGKHQNHAADRSMWSLDDFVIIRKLDEGRFGKVYLAREKQSKCAVVLKCISKDMIRFHSLAHQLQREVELQEYAGRYHKNVLRLFAYFWDDVRIVLVLEYADSGTLQDLLDCYREKEQRSSLPDDKVRTILLQLLSALAFLHERDIIHRDVKPDNILFHGEKLLLADFSWAVRVNNSDPRYCRRHTVCGTLDYLAPEQVLKRGCTTKADLWAVGVVAYRMLCGFLPFEMLDARDVCSCIASGAIRYPSQLSPTARHFLQGLLRVDEALRFSCQEALNHPFMRGDCNCRISNRYIESKYRARAEEPVLQHQGSFDTTKNGTRWIQQKKESWCCSRAPTLNVPEPVHHTGTNCVANHSHNHKDMDKSTTLSCPSASDIIRVRTTTERVRCPVDDYSGTSASNITISPLRSTECMQSLSNVSTPSIVSQTHSEWLHSASPISHTPVVAAAATSKCSRDDVGTSSYGVSYSGIRLHNSASDGSGTTTGQHHVQLGTSTHSSFAFAPPTSARYRRDIRGYHRINGRGSSPSDHEEYEVASCALRLCFDDEDDADNNCSGAPHAAASNRPKTLKSGVMMNGTAPPSHHKGLSYDVR